RCGRRAAEAARRQLAAARREHPGAWLAFLGSGDWHHLSLLLLGTLRSAAPLTLILIDNHPDWSVLPPRHHCGNWVYGAMRPPQVAGAVLLGMDGPDLRARGLMLAPLGAIAAGRARLYPWRTARVRVPLRWPRGAQGGGIVRHAWGTELRFQ